MLKNWKTSLLGVLSFLALVLPSIIEWLKHAITSPITTSSIIGLIVTLIGLFAKDHNVTGT